ncbi:TPA: helix-turn-helix domain-containing protein [Streptococcus agalactiae]|uniref:CI-like repressor n=2 Tax=Bacilli TaxID=91061 RepID=A0A837L1V7_STRAG|nr:S24 family peptidase [Streptococcus agalactiae]KLL46186.1 cI-like repressor [Streptococcus agalactiae]HEM9584170.1 helix-turn-helix domain-containing protein [Streptococcus agalactiae]HEM9597417.1 helix-turn-helix domain-containing protein [Streptococcus agalactiae]HEM9634308.1 helix-turn-helix domain-containing protein [Streptococcus agalactiae]HEN0522413.1 helix-turn-helix domain-containing protein [Streptococcus agalactiae]
MQCSSTSNRLKQLMSERNLRQVDILEKSKPFQKQLGVKMGRSTLSQYVSGKSVPAQRQLYLLSKTLNVSEAWLMGYDVAIERIPDEKRGATTEISNQPEIVSIYEKLEQPRQEKVLNFANEQLEEQNNVISMFDRKVEETENYITDYVEGLVAAGLGAYQEDNLHMEVKLRADDVPDKYDTIAKVAGNSMEPLIQDNDLLFIKVSSQVDMNDIGIFQVNGKNFVKKLKRDYDGAWYLQSLNKSYEEIYLSENDNIRTIGEVVDIYRES